MRSILMLFWQLVVLLLWAAAGSVLGGNCNAVGCAKLCATRNQIMGCVPFALQLRHRSIWVLFRQLSVLLFWAAASFASGGHCNLVCCAKLCPGLCHYVRLISRHILAAF